jgi:hypothetical protein
VIHQ